ncbi:MAG: alpha-isopropylmalate synthase regulatory domain-containing protein [Bacteroides fragilis]
MDITLEYRNRSVRVYEESSSGDGQYDAFVRALRKIYKVTLGRKFPMLINYAVSIPPGGRIRCFQCKPLSPRKPGAGRPFRAVVTMLTSTEAAIKATIKMLNIIEEY